MQNKFHKLLVVLRVRQPFDEKVRRFPGAHRPEQLSQHEHHLGFLLREEQFLLASSRLVNVDSRENTPFRQPPVKMQFAVARALELFEDNVIGPAARLHEGGGDYCQTAAFFDIARRTEETFRSPQ